MFRRSFMLCRKGGNNKTPAFVSSGQRSSASDSSSPSSSSSSRVSLSRASSQSVLDTFLQIQLGTWSPTPQTARQVLLTHFGPRLMQMQLSEAKLAAMDPKRVTKLLKQTLYEQYLAVPFTVLSFDLEFTGIPNFSGDSNNNIKGTSSSGTSENNNNNIDNQVSGETTDENNNDSSSSKSGNNGGGGGQGDGSGGPSEDIVEIALYDPDRKKIFSQLVLPFNRHNMSDGAAALTGISDDDLKKNGKPLVEAWNSAVTFIEDTMKYNVEQRIKQAHDEAVALDRQRNALSNPFGFENAEKNSTAAAAKLAATTTTALDPTEKSLNNNTNNSLSGDDYKINQAERLLLLSHGARLVDIAMINWVQTLEGAKQLPPSTTFGDTLLQIKDLHRRRPVTKDKWPAAWSLEDIATFLGLNIASTHRAAADAELTWDILYHSLDRYGDESLTPRQQLVGRFFDQDAKGVLNAYDEEQQSRAENAQMLKASAKKPGGNYGLNDLVSKKAPAAASGGRSAGEGKGGKTSTKGLKMGEVNNEDLNSSSSTRSGSSGFSVL